MGKNVPLVETQQGTITSTVPTCENGHITVNTQENAWVLSCMCNCDLCIYYLVIKGSISVKQNHAQTFLEYQY